MVKIQIPREAELILQILQDRGFETYVVGGCVRDALLGKTPQDWDICTSALPWQVMETFSNYPVLKTGLKHGTVTVLISERPFEITTYRVESEYSDHRHPDKVEFVSDLRQDLARRDFTINAMAYNPNIGLVDYFNGLQDLHEKTVRCVGEPERRFLEDGLRILRALRFASVYNFTIEKKTTEAIHAKKDLLAKIAAERVQVELNKLLCGTGVKGILQQFADVLAVVIPEITPMLGFEQNNPHHCYDLWTHTVESVAQVPAETVLRLVMLFHELGKPDCYTLDRQGIGHFYGHANLSAEKTKEILYRLRYDRATINDVVTLVKNHDLELDPKKKKLKRVLHSLGLARFKKLLEVQKADNKAKHPRFQAGLLAKIREIEDLLDEIVNRKECFTLQDLAVKGQDLLQIGLKEGPEIGQILNSLLQQVIEEQVENDKEKLLELVKGFRAES